MLMWVLTHVNRQNTIRAFVKMYNVMKFTMDILLLVNSTGVKEVRGAINKLPLVPFDISRSVIMTGTADGDVFDLATPFTDA